MISIKKILFILYYNGLSSIDTCIITTLPNLARCFNRPWPGAGTSPDWPGPAQQLPAAPASPPVLLPVPVDHAWALAVWPILWILPGLSAALLLRALAAGPILWILPGLSAALLLLLRALDSAGIVCCTAAAGTCCSGADPAVSAGFRCTAAAGTCCCGADPAVSPRFGCTAAGGTCCCGRFCGLCRVCCLLHCFCCGHHVWEQFCGFCRVCLGVYGHGLWSWRLHLRV